MNKFKSFLNDEIAVKKVLIFLTPFLLALLVFAGIKLGAYIKNSEPAPEHVENEITEQATENEPPTEDNVIFEESEDEEEYIINLPTKFESFECEGKYYSFDDLKNQYGYSFEKQYSKDKYSNSNGNFMSRYKIVYAHNDAEQAIFEVASADGNVIITTLEYIDDYLFFTVLQNKTRTLYRMAFEYDESGNIISHEIYFVAEKAELPVKALKNTLIIRKEYGEEYVSLNTKTGEIKPIEYDYEVDPSSVKVSVSLDKAIEIAEKELEKDEYRVFNGISEEKYIPNVDGIAPVLIHYPDLIFRGGYKNNRFEDYPEYVWVVAYDTESLYQQVRIFVNAKSGEISYVQIQPYP